MNNCPVPWYTVVDEMSVDENVCRRNVCRRSVVDEMSVDELSWNRPRPILSCTCSYKAVLLNLQSIVIVNSKLLKSHSKAKRRAPAYSRALRQIRGVFQRIVRGRLRSVFHAEGERMHQIRGVFQRIVRGKFRSGCQKVRGGRLGVKAGVV